HAEHRIRDAQEPRWLVDVYKRQHLPLNGTELTTNINGSIAETDVTQTYANEGEHPINASYGFPASTKVSVHGMKMKIGNQVVTARIQEKEEAKQTYEAAKSEGKSASLLEEKRSNVFTMDVANIMPGDTICIELHYTELIESTEGVYQFVFPTVVGPRYAGEVEEEDMEDGDWVQSPYFEEGVTPDSKYEITVNLSAGVPITELTCGTHEVTVEYTEASQAKVTLSNPEEYAGNRDFILDYQMRGEDVSSGLMLYKGEEENYFLLTMQPPKRYKADELLPREYIFVLDVSGSMSGYPLDTAKELMEEMVGNLREGDCFNLFLFSDIVSEMSLESVAATKENMDCAKTLIAIQEGGWGSELAKALERAIAT
ncbi:MAG: VIT and VWA domain-containing protein, partial [Lachnospiraceae bacterium]|nr:VIT and VWA domain-containing protein [Lachnospiraceae bacterium]